MTASGEVNIDVSGLPATTTTLECSEDLKVWTPLNSGGEGSIFSDPGTGVAR